MRHVVLITTSYPDNSPGSEAAGSFVEDFARELSQHLRVTVIAPGTAASSSDDGNLSVQRFRVPRLPLSLLRPLNPFDWPAIVRSLRAGRESLESLVREDTPDHIFALWALPSGYWARKVAARYGIGYSVWALGSDIWTLGKVPLVRGVLRSVLQDAERCYADGLQLAANVTASSGLPCEFMASTRILPSTGKAKRRQGDRLTFAYLGRWHHNKGIDLLLDACDLLSDEDWARIDALRIFGGGPYNDVVHRRVRKLADCGRSVSVGGFLDKPAAAALIESADFLLLPSRIESIPVIFSDAMQLNTPIVSTPVGDLPRLFDKYRVGVLASAVNGVAFSDAIRQALNEDVRAFDKSISRARQDFDLTEVVRRFVTQLRKPPL